jgi:hypothetical protein
MDSGQLRPGCSPFWTQVWKALNLTYVREAVVPGAGHWLMEESPTAILALILDFLDARTAVAAPPISRGHQRRITPSEFPAAVRPVVPDPGSLTTFATGSSVQSDAIAFTSQPVTQLLRRVTGPAMCETGPQSGSQCSWVLSRCVAGLAF